MKNKINVVIADDHFVVLLGVRKSIEDDSDLHVVSAITGVGDLLESLKTAQCDVLICDYSFSRDDEPDGLELFKKILRLYPEIKMIVLTSYGDVRIVQHAMRLGVMGFLSKSSRDFSELPKAIRAVFNNERYIDRDTTSLMIATLVADGGSETSLADLLTSREMEIVRLFCTGMTVTEIAQYANRSMKTISTQKRNAMIKLEVRNDIELLKYGESLFGDPLYKK